MNKQKSTEPIRLKPILLPSPPRLPTNQTTPSSQLGCSGLGGWVEFCATLPIHSTYLAERLKRGPTDLIPPLLGMGGVALVVKAMLVPVIDTLGIAHSLFPSLFQMKSSSPRYCPYTKPGTSSPVSLPSINTVLPPSSPYSTPVSPSTSGYCTFSPESGTVTPLSQPLFIQTDDSY
ncbi:unnamed protein product [Haemonchus placei]|uniref:Protein TIC 20 n=1 Tax=Haemonchus placei TaxID=6290 RepID=A0A0N4X5G4_HAEPC|nr:unnamed protein product [Haemonchus placei]